VDQRGAALTGVVLDASVLGALVIPDEATNEHPSLIDVLGAGVAVVPAHWHLEIANLGRSAIRRGRLDESAFAARLADLGTFEIETDLETPQRAWGDIARLAAHHGLTSYDAAYLELAVRRSALLLCDDAALSKAALAHGVELL